LLGWAEHTLEDNPRYFRRRRGGQLCQLAGAAAAGAIVCGTDLTIGWGSVDLWTTPLDEVEAHVRALRPSVMFLPARPKSDDWAIISLGEPEIVSRAAVQRRLDDLVAQSYPEWRHGPSSWTCTALLVRHGKSAEEFGLVEPEPLVGDAILGAIANDPEVHAAFVREDPALPETAYELARQRLLAQERLGIPPENRVVLFSGQVEGLLTFPLTRSPFDPDAALALLRRQLRPYREFAEVVLQQALRDFPVRYVTLEQLREAARASAV